MNYPRITIDLGLIRQNVNTIVELCKKNNIQVAGVTKVFCGDPLIAQAYIDGGVSYLADSRVENLIRMKDLKIPKLMLRLPMISEASEIVKYADISLNSQLETIKALSKEAIKQDMVHKIILMMDLGDLREGYYDDRMLIEDIKEIINLSGVEILGLGTNLTCYGGVIPTKETLDQLKNTAKMIENEFGIKLEIVSGGNSSSIHLLDDQDIDGINHLRLGESLILGNETAYGTQIPRTSDEAFVLKTEIIEIKEKPSMPKGEIGRDAFGLTPTFIDRGVRKRILCAIGKQDVDFDALYPIDKKIIILGGSSDHLILDASDSQIDYNIGDIIEFKMDYVSILRAMTSQYIKKEILG